MKNIFVLFFITIFAASAARAVEPQIWSVDTRAEVLRGEARGVSVNDVGAITLAPRLAQIFNAEQPFVWSSAADANGNVYLGTGGEGKIFKVTADGKGALVYDTNELNVAALAVGKAGEIYAGTAPDGRVYRINADGRAEIFFEPKEKYIWSLATLSDGSLAVGTGENGKIYRVKTAGAKPEASLLFDSSETHIISLAADARGNLYAGTDGGGLVLRFASDGRAFALLDSPLREIHDIAVGADGSIYALALSDSASAQKPASAVGTNADGSGVSATIVSTEAAAPAPEQPAKSRYDLSAAKSAVYRIAPDGGNEIVWNSPSVTAFSIAADRNGVLLGTSDKGRIYAVGNDGRETLLLQSGEGQISTIKNVGNQIYATSSNQGKLYRFGAETETQGTYESTVLDAKGSANWGRIWWRSSPGGNVVLQTRSGNTQTPNETWSDWSAAYATSAGAQITSPTAKYLQWRAVLKSQANGVSNVAEVNVSYLPRNIAPEILSIQVLPTNVGLVANPPLQIDPNIENSGLDPSLFGFPSAAIPPRRVFQRGARAVQWTAEDRNADRLEYDVFFREINESTFKLLRENQRENFFTLDGSALSDGRYIFRIVAKDAPSNPPATSLSGERQSETVDFDNTPPTVSAAAPPQMNGDRARAAFEATDAASRLTRAEYSVNGGAWQEIFADDGISDNRTERYTVEVSLQSAGEYTITLRVFDANGNVGSARAAARK